MRWRPRSPRTCATATFAPRKRRRLRRRSGQASPAQRTCGCRDGDIDRQTSAFGSFLDLSAMADEVRFAPATDTAVARCRGACLRWRDTIPHPRFQDCRYARRHHAAGIEDRRPPMMNAMVCHITEGELRIEQEGKTFTAKKNFVWTCDKGTNEQRSTTGTWLELCGSRT
jgi:hypothetical protein